MERFSNFKIEHNSLSEKAYHTVKSFIIDNSLRPGEKIIQGRMADQLGISKIPLIQALTSLYNEGLLEKLPRKGFYVRKFSKTEINEIFDIRSALEMLSVSFLTKKITPEIKKNLENFLKDFEQAYNKNNSKKYYNVDVSFHQYLIESSKNELLKTIIENFNILLICYTKGFVLELDESYSQHKDLIQAIINGDVSKAEMSIKKHIGSIKDKFSSINNS